MAIGEARRRVLLVSDDDQFSADLKPRLPGMEVLSLTESSVWVADRAGLNVTRGIDAVLLDNHVSGRLQLRLYEKLRPTDAVADVPVIFTRSKLSAATGGFDHELDMYQSQDAGPAETATLVRYVLGTPEVPPRVQSRMSVPILGGRGRSVNNGTGPGFFQRLMLWGVASALIGFTFWPLVGSGPIREAVFGPIKALSGSSGLVATDAIPARTSR
jgi:hypothetical protein